MRKFTQILFLALFSFFIFSYSGRAQSKTTSGAATKQQALPAKAEAPSPALQKIDPQLLSSLQQSKQANTDMGKANSVSTMVSVEIKCIVTEALLKSIQTTGGKVFSNSAANNSIFARVPLLAVEKIASSDDVKYIQQSADLFINSTKTPPGKNKEMLKAKAGKSSTAVQQ
jgi:hypothetical protein